VIRSGQPAQASAIKASGVPVAWGAAAALFVLASGVLGLLVGAVHIGVGATLASVLSHLGLPVHVSLDRAYDGIVWELRLPRIVLGCLVGGMLAVAGSAYQGVFRNPLAEPYLLGVAAGAGFGATAAIAYGPGSRSAALPLAAFAGAAGAVALAYVLGRSAGFVTTASLILAGVTIAAMLTAAQTFVQQQRSNTIRDVYAWLLGGLDTAGWRDVVLAGPYIAVSAAVLLVHRRALDVLSVGDDEAQSLGLDVVRTRLLIVTMATLGTAAAVAVSGLIGFVGIIVPHTVRLLVSRSYRAIVPLSLALGAGFLVLADVVARTAIAPAELPIGVVTAFCGAPFFAVVLRTSRTVGP
jgi:iron complex transport system permease protein